VTGLSLALDGLWQSIAHKAQTCPVSFAAPVLCDIERLANGFNRDTKPTYGTTLRDKLIVRLQDALDRFVVEHSGAFFDKTKRVQPLFVRKYPGIIDRLEAATRGFGDDVTAATDTGGEQPFAGSKPVTDNVLQLIAALPSPYSRLENLYFMSSALRLRIGNMRGLDAIFKEVDAKFEESLIDVVSALLDSSPFSNVVRLARASEEEDVAFTRMELDEALAPIQIGLDKAVQQAKSAVETKLSIPRLRGHVWENSRDSLIDNYWRFAELAAENFGVNVQPSAGLVKDAWNRLLQ
jgi:hypothetical protein